MNYLVNLVFFILIKWTFDCVTEDKIVIQSCITIAQMSYDYISCVKTARKSWKMDKIQENEDDENEQIKNNRYLYCCGTWDINDCVKDATNKVCTDAESDAVEDMMADISRALERNNCSVYPYKSWNCHFPFWLSSLIVIASIVVVSLTAYICVHCLFNND